MDISHYTQHIPEIEKRISDLKPDAIVLGLGPTAWLLPWIDQKLLRGVKKIGGHDACKIMPCDEILLLDRPVLALHRETDRFKTILASRPNKFWVYSKNWDDLSGAPQGHVPGWKGMWPQHLLGITEILDFDVWHPATTAERTSRKELPKLDGDPPPTSCISPTGCTSIAWRGGSRRIGIIGMDMMPNHHHTYSFSGMVNWVFKILRRRAVELGGEIVNLSPISTITKIQPEFNEKCDKPTSGSDPIDTSKPPEPSESLSTASASTQASR